MYIGDKTNKKGMIVSGLYVKGTINPHNDKKADKGVNVFSSTAYCLSLIKGAPFYPSMSIYDELNFESIIIIKPAK